MADGECWYDLRLGSREDVDILFSPIQLFPATQSYNVVDRFSPGLTAVMDEDFHVLSATPRQGTHDSDVTVVLPGGEGVARANYYYIPPVGTTALYPAHWEKQRTIGILGVSVEVFEAPLLVFWGSGFMHPSQPSKQQDEGSWCKILSADALRPAKKIPESRENPSQ